MFDYSKKYAMFCHSNDIDDEGVRKRKPSSSLECYQSSVAGVYNKTLLCKVDQ